MHRAPRRSSRQGAQLRRRGFCWPGGFPVYCCPRNTTPAHDRRSTKTENPGALSSPGFSVCWIGLAV